MQSTRLPLPYSDTSVACFLLSRGVAIGSSILKAGAWQAIGLSLMRKIITLAPNQTPAGQFVFGAVKQSVVEAAKVTYDLSVYILGENPPEVSQGGVSCFLKEKSWSVINGAKQFLEFLDVCYSNYFHIRTQAEMGREYPTEEILYTHTSLSEGEILRLAFLKTAEAIFSNQIPSALSYYLVEKMGYAAVPGFALFVKAMPIVLIAQVLFEYNSISQEISQKISQELEERKSLFAELPGNIN